jgi:acyl-CoA thioesterase-1
MRLLTSGWLAGGALLFVILAAGAVLLALQEKPDTQAQPAAKANPSVVPPTEPGAPPAGRSPSLLLFGDSLTAGYGLAAEDGFSAVLAQALAARGAQVKIINAGVSGDTTATGLARLDWVLAAELVDAVMVELGANDALRGMDPAETEKNLRRILDKLKLRRLPVLLAGMRAPPNLGRRYETAYNEIFPRLAEDYDVLFYPFFLADVAAERNLNQPDGIHPNAAGVKIIVDNMLPSVRSLLDQAAQRAKDNKNGAE